MYFVKTILSLIVLVVWCLYANAQHHPGNYDVLWKNVEQAVKKGLTQTALTEVKKIYALAKKEKQEAQLIKALLYQAGLNESTEENAFKNTISVLTKEVASAGRPAASILNSIRAEMYWNYFQQHRWQIYNRTTTSYINNDIATWSATAFHDTIGALFLTSLENKKLLQQTTLQSYEPIILKGNARYLRPTLYDLLAHRALDYFTNDEHDINKPAYAFELKDEQYFAPADAFAKMRITTRDSSSLHHKALLIFQELLLLHDGDARPDAWIDADLLRIQFVHRYSVMENKDTAYVNALQNITLKYPEEPAAAQAWFLQAQWHAEKAAGYNPLKDTSNRFGYVRAKNICEKVIAQPTDSEGKSNCRTLLQSIRQKQLNLQTEKVNLPGQPFRTLISFKNFTKVYFRIIPLSDDLREQLRNRYDDAYWRRLATLKFIRSWDQSLLATNDFQQHSTEIKVDALPVGAYVLLASVNDNFTVTGNPMAVQYFHVSDISYVNNGDEYFVLNRESGRPLASAAVQTWINKYNYQSRKEELTKAQQVNADLNGYFRLASDKKNPQNIRLDIRYKDDRLFMDDNQYTYNRVPEDVPVDINAEEYETKNARVFLFTDRSIYRPGQTVYFKGIVITKASTTRNNKVFSNRKTWVRVYNANGEPADSLALTTNEFGSYAGKFTLPQNGLNGSFRLADDAFKGDVSFSVEEYKRPRFYVVYEKLKGTYRVNDSIVVNGSAKAFAGNNIDGATVKYRVVREAKFIYPWLYWKWGIPRGSNMEITNGTVTTNTSGEFSISFKAIPDLTVNKAFDPIFDYKVIADITDINGETRSNETIIPVSYKALQLKMGLSSGDVISIDSFKTISVITQSLNGEFEPAQVHVTISRLQAPERLIRKRYWQQPDLFVLPEEAFIKAFPHDEYVNETDYRNWAKKEKMYEATDSTRAGENIGIRNTNFTSGWYVVEATTRDRYGEEVKDVQYIALHDEKSKRPLSQQYAWSTQKNRVIQPGETSTITIGSSASDLFVIQHINKPLNTVPSSKSDTSITGNHTSSYSFTSLNNENKSFNFSATENDRGGYGVNHFFVSNNRLYALTNQVSVPWTNKELNISYGTFRDKTLPGSEEKWTLKISGYKNEKVAAEMLASMYDASLDQFRPHGWNVPPVWNSYSNQDPWNGYSNFAAVQSEEKYINDVTLSYFEKRYDRLASVVNRRNIRIREYSMGRKEILNELSGVAPGVAIDYGKGMIEARKVESDKLTPPQVVKDEETEQISTVKNDFNPIQEVSIRKNFNETSFFLPDLRTDADGNIEFSFTMPEALTRWKFQALAYTREAAFGYSTKDIITQKQLMVQPNAPRFLREGDRMQLSTKIVNLTAKELTGTVQLELLDAATMQPVDGWFQNMTANQYFTADAGKSVSSTFTVQIPYQYNSAILYRFVAKAATGNTATGEAVSDGEEAILPVLTNSMLVTESMSLPVRGDSIMHFRFDKLLQSGNSETLQHHALTVEFTSNPAWYAVQSLPYLSEIKYENVEQVFNRYYASALAVKIANSSPRIKEIFEKWKNAVPGSKDDSTLFSNLQKNEELKSVLLQETPWVLEAKSETQQKKNLALLFDMVTMNHALEASLQLLKQYQSANGGFVWCKGGPDDRYFTQYIITGLGRLHKLNALPASARSEVNGMISKAMAYLDKRLEEDYKNLIRYKAYLRKNNIGYLQVQYLYLRSFFKADDGGEQSAALTYYRKQSQRYWLQQNKFMQGMIALYLHRTGDNITAKKIIESLQQNAIINEEAGMYWKDHTGGYFWHQAPVETQSLLIEAFSEISGDVAVINDLKTWLLKQKQTQHWKSSKATADACYALLLQGADWLKASPVADIRLGDKTVTSTDSRQEAGTGYFDKSFTGPFVNPAMGNISVQIHPDPLPVNNNAKAAGPAWGAVYWQYFEKLDKITPAATPLKLVKKLFVERSADRGPELHPVKDGDVLKIGDKIKVRIELVVDRDMEYVHMKDMRASAMEPVNVLSAYKWQGGLGYYETTKDAATNFFFNWLPKGTYVFEYPLLLSHAGDFSNGITSIQCLYAPEFASHSEGVRVSIE